MSEGNFVSSLGLQANVFDVARYILGKTGSISTMKLQKLVYYCQAWSLVWDEQPLFEQKIEAWANGPVVPVLYDAHKGLFSIKDLRYGNVEKLSEKQIETIDSVLDELGNKPAKWLIDLTHMEDPWLNARTGLSTSDRGNVEITHESMFDYYSSL